MATLYKVPTENNLQYTLDVKYTAGDTSLTLSTDVSTVVQAPGVCVVDRIDSNGNKTASKRTYYSFTAVSGAQLTGLAAVDGTDQDHQVGAIVEFVPDVDTFQSYYDVITTEHNADGTHSDITATTVTTTGDINSTGAVKADTVSEHTLDAGVTVDGVLLKDSQVTTDTINEQTAGAGVTVDGVLLKDSQVTTDTINEQTAGAGVTVDGVKLKDGSITANEQPRVGIYNSASQTIANGTWTILNFDSENYDVGGFHDTTTNNDRITIPTGEDGVYLIIANINFASNSTGERFLRLFKNGVDTLDASDKAVGTSSTRMVLTGILNLSATDYIQIGAYQDSGGDLDVESTSKWTVFKLV